jgi:hypothetical protein
MLQSGPTTPTTDPTALLSAQLDHATAVRWKAVLDYRDAMAEQRETVVFAPFGGVLDQFIRLHSTERGAELVILGRSVEAGRFWDALPGDRVQARLGESILHGAGADLDLWQVCGRFRRITTAAHPDNPAERVHVLHHLEGVDR